MAGSYNNSSMNNNNRGSANGGRDMEKSLKTWKIIAVAAIICIAFMAGNMIGGRGKNDPQPQGASETPAEVQSVAQSESSADSQLGSNSLSRPESFTNSEPVSSITPGSDTYSAPESDMNSVPQTDSFSNPQTDSYDEYIETPSNYDFEDYDFEENDYSESASSYDQDDFQIVDNETGMPIIMGVSGVYTSCLYGFSTDLPYIDRVESLRGTITLGGTFEIRDSGSGSNGVSPYMILDVAYNENTVFCGSHGEAYTADEFVDIMKSFNGLGLELDIDEGNLTKAILLS